jgi:hypothetical protein
MVSSAIGGFQVISIFLMAFVVLSNAKELKDEESKLYSLSLLLLVSTILTFVACIAHYLQDRMANVLKYTIIALVHLNLIVNIVILYLANNVTLQKPTESTTKALRTLTTGSSFVLGVNIVTVILTGYGISTNSFDKL